MNHTLTQLHNAIDSRVQSISTANQNWLCQKGCDACCRRLAEIPRLTEAEWQLLQTGLKQLPDAQRLAIDKKIIALSEQHTRPLTCPMLESSSGACSVYAYRPVACRTYGFYVQRDKG